MQVRVVVKLKKGVDDPEGMSTKKALNLLGFKVRDVRCAKVYEIDLDAENGKDAVQKAEEMCRKLLANPVIHEYSVEVK